MSGAAVTCDCEQSHAVGTIIPTGLQSPLAVSCAAGKTGTTAPTIARTFELLQLVSEQRNTFKRANKRHVLPGLNELRTLGTFAPRLALIFAHIQITCNVVKLQITSIGAVATLPLVTNSFETAHPLCTTKISDSPLIALNIKGCTTKPGCFC